MSISDDNDLKCAVELLMPDTVIAMNVFYFKTDFQEPQEETLIVEGMKDWVEALYGALVSELSDNVTLGVMTGYQYITLQDEWLSIGAASPTVNFANANDMLPHGVSGLVRAYTTRTKTIGRKYIPGYTEEDNVNGAWVAAAITSMTAFSVLWGTQEPLDANNRLNPGVFSTTTKLVHELTDEFVILADPAYQRRRRPGVGV